MSTGIQMMLKSLGLDPEQIIGQVQTVAADVKRVAEALENLERQNAAVLSVLRLQAVNAPEFPDLARKAILAVIDGATQEPGNATDK